MLFYTISDCYQYTSLGLLKKTLLISNFTYSKNIRPSSLVSNIAPPPRQLMLGIFFTKEILIPTPPPPYYQYFMMLDQMRVLPSEENSQKHLHHYYDYTKQLLRKNLLAAQHINVQAGVRLLIRRLIYMLNFHPLLQPIVITLGKFE